MVQYRYAYYSYMERVSIEQVNRNNRNQRFTSINCKEELVSHLWKNEDSNQIKHTPSSICSYDAYL